MRVKPNHPLAELLAQLLFGIETIPAKCQKRAINRACREATKWHKAEVLRVVDWIKDMEKYLVIKDAVCPECDRRLGKYTSSPYHPGVHKRDCDLAILLGLFEE